jgi:predicted RNase H-like HicB family nuclease
MAKSAKRAKKYTVTDGKLVLVLEVAEEGGYLVTAPFDPDVLTQAETVEEAFEMARDLIALLEEDRAAERKAARQAGKRAAKLTA